MTNFSTKIRYLCVLLLRFKNFIIIKGGAMADIKAQLGARIKELRKSKNITQEELVEVIGSDTNNLSRIENGKKFMSAEKLEKIAGALNVDIKELFDFGHILSDDELKAEIISDINSLSTKQLKYIYKAVKNLKELN